MYTRNQQNLIIISHNYSMYFTALIHYKIHSAITNDFMLKKDAPPKNSLIQTKIEIFKIQKSYKFLKIRKILFH